MSTRGSNALPIECHSTFVNCPSFFDLLLSLLGKYISNILPVKELRRNKGKAVLKGWAFEDLTFVVSSELDRDRLRLTRFNWSPLKLCWKWAENLKFLTDGDWMLQNPSPGIFQLCANSFESSITFPVDELKSFLASPSKLPQRPKSEFLSSGFAVISSIERPSQRIEMPKESRVLEGLFIPCA